MILETAKLMWKTHNHQICLVTGLTLMTAGAVYGCVQATKLQPIISEWKKKRDDLTEFHKADDEAAKEIKEKEGWTDEKYNMTKIGYFCHEALEIGAKFAIPAVIFATGMTLTCFGFHLLAGKYTAAVTVANGLQLALNSYRKRWQDKVGVEEEQKVWYGVEEVDVLNDKGKPTGEKAIASVNPTEDAFSDIFDSISCYWTGNRNQDLNFLRSVEETCTSQLIMNGHLFLNEVRKMLDLPLRKSGHNAGWLLKDFEDELNSGKKKWEGPSEDRMHMVDFGIFDPINARWLNNAEEAVALRFNCKPDITSDPNMEWNIHHSTGIKMKRF